MPDTSKHSYDPALFKPEPPMAPKLIERLFYGRTAELDRGLQTIKNHGDRNGRRAEKGEDKRPWVIHGESRSGKSHLARRILVGLPNTKKRIKLTIPAREKLQAVEVLWNLFDELRAEFNTRIRDQSLRNDPFGQPVVQWTVEMVEGIASLVPGADKVEFTVESSATDTFEASGGPAVFRLLQRTQRTKGESSTVTLRNPTARDLAEYCGMMIDTLWRAKLVNHVVVLVDDVDLLEGYRDRDSNGKIQRSKLSDAIGLLHEAPCIDVILTARSWYANSKKELQLLVDLSRAQSQFIPEDLIKIHDRRCEALVPSGLPRGFLAREALLQAASDVKDGLPGVFLQHLDTAFQSYKDEDEWGERDYEWYLNVFVNLWNDFRSKYPQAAKMLEQAVENKQFEIDVSEGNPLYRTVFDGEFVFQSYYQEETYYTDSLAHKAIQRSKET